MTCSCRTWTSRDRGQRWPVDMSDCRMPNKVSQLTEVGYSHDAWLRTACTSAYAVPFGVPDGSYSLVSETFLCPLTIVQYLEGLNRVTVRIDEGGRGQVVHDPCRSETRRPLESWRRVCRHGVRIEASRRILTNHVRKVLEGVEANLS